MQDFIKLVKMAGSEDISRSVFTIGFLAWGLFALHPGTEQCGLILFSFLDMKAASATTPKLAALETEESGNRDFFRSFGLLRVTLKGRLIAHPLRFRGLQRCMLSPLAPPIMHKPSASKAPFRWNSSVFAQAT